ncbi:MAG: heme-binding protein [Rhodanobacteraceae bacterium]
MTQQTTSVDLADARRIIGAGELKAAELGVASTIAVVDVGGHLVAQARMDGAWIGSIAIALDKAWTSRATDQATENLAGVAQSGDALFGLNTTNAGRPVIFGGGLPIRQDGHVIGAVGVSGGTVDEDVAVARAALAGFAD